MLQKTISLVGLMGAGKTSLGRLLAKRTKATFVDSDAVIEDQQGKSIADLIAQQGEPFFRICERDTIIELISARDKMILATGGGAFINEHTREAMLEKSLVIWLKADRDILLERLERTNTQTRPLLAGKHLFERLQELMDQRYPIYQNAHMIFECRHETLEESIIRLEELINAA